MIMTSFYFSIGGILALGLYGIYRYARTKERAEEMITVKGFLGDGLRFAGRILTAIMLAGVLLVPTAMALLGRSGSKGEKTDIWQLLTPQINLEKFLYGAYGPGLSCLMLIILLTGLFYKKAYEKILSLGCLVVLTVPFFFVSAQWCTLYQTEVADPVFAASVLSYGKISGEAEKSEK